jgi:hypothetical protein
MLAHAILIGGERAARARRSHSFELARHSVTESVGHIVCPIGHQVHTFYLNGPAGVALRLVHQHRSLRTSQRDRGRGTAGLRALNRRRRCPERHRAATASGFV